MAVFKCKMCGGALEVAPGTLVAKCEYCETTQTLPNLSDDRRANTYDRANHFRRNNEFDKAMSLYESLLNEDSSDAEAYWSIVLCRYGIEYVEDPMTRRRIPTVNRAQFTSILADDYYKSALRYADASQKIIYENEAKAIDEIQKNILLISQKEEPFDVFICYKETDADGRRTQDSVLAQDLYYGLTDEGFKVFFSRITLEDKLGSAYEPYIFAALNSAKVMVVVGTRPEHLNAVWVKNEWSRYLALIKQGKRKTLIPAYKDMDPYDLPEEFSHLQAQDMSKLGFMQDLVRGIKKILGASNSKASVGPAAAAATSAELAPLIKRIHIFLEDGNWESANEYCEKVLDRDPENAQVYVAKLMADLHVKRQAELELCSMPFDRNVNYLKAYRYGDALLRNALDTYNKRIRENGVEIKYIQAKNAMASATSNKDFLNASALFANLEGYKDSEFLKKQCEEKADAAHLDAILASARQKMAQNTTNGYTEAIRILNTIRGWRNADDLIATCQRKNQELFRAQSFSSVNTPTPKSNGKRKLGFALIFAGVFLMIVAILVSKITKSAYNDYDYDYDYNYNDNYNYDYDYKEQANGNSNYKENSRNDSTAKPSLSQTESNASETSLSTQSGTTIAQNSITYTKVGSEYHITGATISSSSLTIPSTYNGLPVTMIKASAFKGCGNLKSLTISDNIMSIGDSAFQGCNALTSVTLESGVESIGEYAFAACGALTSISIPSSVTTIGEYAFYNCKSLETVMLSSYLTEISAGTFYDCTALTNIAIENGVKEIGDSAFYNCKALTDISIPGSVTNIGKYAFKNCSNLNTAAFYVVIGWGYSSTANDIYGTPISDVILISPEDAATGLSSTYTNYYWTWDENYIS